MLTRFTAAAAAALLMLAMPLHADETTAAPPPRIYEVPVEPMSGTGDTTASLAPYEGRALLIVNVASKCGYTKQYTALEALHREYEAAGLSVLGFPCNDFGGQEPGTEEEIREFCTSKFDVTFPLFGKLHAKGENQSPLYKFLTEEATSPFPGEVKWNFEKFLIGRDGTILARYASRTTPDDPELRAAVEKALGE